MREKITREFFYAGSRGQAPILVTAGLAAAMLLAAIGWQLGGEMRSQSTAAATLDFERPTSEEVLAKRPTNNRDWQEELALLGLVSTSTDTALVSISTTSAPSIGDTIAEQFVNGYLSLKESGRYTPAIGRDLGQDIGSNVRAPSNFVMHGKSELSKKADTSVASVLAYRADMRDALEVLVNNAPPEFETFGYYVETKNPERLRELEKAAERYRAAEQKALATIVPQDGASIHLRVINSLGSYADALDQLVRYAEGPLATIAVLRTYNEAEREMLYAFDALASYYVRKIKE